MPGRFSRLSLAGIGIGLILLVGCWLAGFMDSPLMAVPPPPSLRPKIPTPIKFDINRIELFFENRRAEITVERNFPRLKAYANIRFSGSGLLQGYWKVDHRIIAYVNQFLAPGQTVTLETPPAPPLPTFDTGTHLVELVVTNPSTLIPLPTVIYFVSAKDFPTAPVQLALSSPVNKAELDYEPQTLEWETHKNAALYLVEFYGPEKKAGPLFSAYTLKPVYSLPDRCFGRIFVKTSLYSWKVKGFDNQGRKVGESDWGSFSFR